MTLFVPRYLQVNGDGNSLTVGSGAATPATQNWIAQTKALLDTSQPSRPNEYWGFINHGTGSITTTTLISRFEATVHPFHNPGRKRNIVAFLETINDIRQGNVTDAQALANNLLYIEQARDLGWEVLLFTVPPTGPADTLDDGLEGVTTGPLLVSEYFRNNITRLSPFPLVDLQAAGLHTGIVQTPGDWHEDEVHPNETGYAKMAAAAYAALVNIR